MNIVHVPDDIAGPGGELIGIETAKEVGFVKPTVHVSHADADKPTGLELAAALGDLHLADFSRPVIDILKQVPVNGLKVCKVEIAGVSAFNKATARQESLGTG